METGKNEIKLLFDSKQEVKEIPQESWPLNYPLRGKWPLLPKSELMKILQDV
jgi:hypothetical protein